MADGKTFTMCIEFTNNLEAFAMAFNKGLADESVVYESVARSYCDIVEELYLYYCMQRSDKHSGEYDNTISLYKKWRKRLQLPVLREAKKEIDEQLDDVSEEDLIMTPIGA